MGSYPPQNIKTPLIDWETLPVEDGFWSCDPPNEIISAVPGQNRIQANIQDKRSHPGVFPESEFLPLLWELLAFLKGIPSLNIDIAPYLCTLQKLIKTSNIYNKSGKFLTKL